MQTDADGSLGDASDAFTTDRYSGAFVCRFGFS